MFSHAYPARRPQRVYSELDALADDLEHRASLARQAARRQPVAPVPRYFPRDAAYPVAHAYERASRYHRQVSFSRCLRSILLSAHIPCSQQPYSEPVYDQPEPEYFYERPSRPERRAYYEPEPVYDDASYAYEDEYEYTTALQPAPARPRSVYYDDELESAPQPIPRRRLAPPQAIQRRPTSAYSQPPSYDLEYDEEVAAPAPVRPQPRQQRPVPQQALRVRRDVEAPTEPPRPRSAHHHHHHHQQQASQENVGVQLQDVLGLLQNVLSPPTAPAPAPTRRPVTPSPQPQQAPTDPALELLQQLFGGEQPQRIQAPQHPVIRRAAPAPAAVQPRAPVAAPAGVNDMEAVLRQLFGGQAAEQPRAAPAPAPIRAPQPQPEASVPAMQDFLSQMFGLMSQGQQQQSLAAQAPQQQQPQGPAQQLKAVRFNIGPQAQVPAQVQRQVRRSAWKLLPARPHSDSRNCFDPQQPATSSPENKVAYTFALPASAQLGAIPQRPTTQPTSAGGIPRLPVPGRTFQHIPPNPHDAEASRVQVQRNAGAADEVADIKEAIRRSLDPKENVAAEVVAASPAAAAAASVPTSAVEAQQQRAASPTPSDETSAAMAAIDHIEERFVNLSYDFKFPTSPDFTLSPSTDSATSALLYTPTNAPIRAYEHSLTSLLTDLDAVESFGDDEVRHARKEMVKRIEHALVVLESEKEEAWRVFRGLPAASEPPTAAPAVDVAEEESKAVDEEVEGYVIPEAAQPVVEEAEAAIAVEAEVADTVSTEEPVAEVDSVVDDVADEAPADDVPVEETIEQDEQSTLVESEPTTSSYPPSTSYPPAPVSRSSFPPSPSHDDVVVEAYEPATDQVEERAIDSLGSSPVDVPSELDSDSDNEQTATAHEDDDELPPPSMEESAHLEEKTEFIML